MPREPNAAIMAATGLGRSLWAHCAVIEEPRRAEKTVCPLPEILLLLLVATLAGADDLVEVRPWGRQHLAFLRRCLRFRRGIPRHDRLGDVIHAIEPALFRRCFLSWVEALREAEPDIVALDGKTSHRCHARAKGREALHLVSAPPAPLAPAPAETEPAARRGRARRPTQHRPPLLSVLDGVGRRFLRLRGAGALGHREPGRWVLDLVFRDDLTRLRTGHGPRPWPPFATGP